MTPPDDVVTVVHDRDMRDEGNPVVGEIIQRVAPDPSFPLHEKDDGNGAVPQHGVHQQARPAVRGAPPLQIDALTVLNAFRRRWLLALSLGFLAAVPAASTGWFLLPAPFITFSELRISSVRDRVLFPTAEQEAVFKTYKQTHIKLVTSPYVLNAAIREPENANSQLLREKERPRDWLEQEIKVSSVGEEFLRISLAGERPKELAAIVNAVTNSFLDEIVATEEQDRRTRLATLEKVLAEVQAQLQSKRNSLKILAESAHTTDPATYSIKQQMEAEYFTQLRKELAEVRFDLMRAKAELTTSQNQIGQVEQLEIPEALLEAHIEDELEYQEMTAYLSRQKRLADQLLERVGSGHPALEKVQTTIEATQSQLEELRKKLMPVVKDRLQQQIAVQTNVSEIGIQQKIGLLDAQREQLEEELRNQKVQEKKSGGVSYELRILDADLENTARIERSVADEIKHLEIELNSQPRIKSHRAAEVPYKRDQKRRIAGTFGAGLGGFAVVVCLVLLVEILARRINSLDELSSVLGVRVVGTLPIVSSKALSFSTQSNGNGQATAGWHREMSESINLVRTVLLAGNKSELKNTWLVSSAIAGEGKTSFSCHLAASLARAGRKTLLVDGDMRRPSVNSTLGLPLTPGFCELLRGEANLDEVIRTVSLDGLAVITAGKSDDRARELLARGCAHEFFEQFKQQFEFVVVDSSPVVPVPDAMLIAEQVDGIILSMRRDVSSIPTSAAAIKRFATVGIPIVGCVVIGFAESWYRKTSYNYDRENADNNLLDAHNFEEVA